MLKRNAFPSLRYMLYAGEPLTLSLARVSQEASPHARIENLYGPTELFICTNYRWDPLKSEEESERNIVPIGYPVSGMKYLVVDEELNSVGSGEKGELLMSGSQLSLGYLNDPERTRQSFVVPPGKNEVYYRTGDIVNCPVGDMPVLYYGRRDSQIQIRGARVELGEIEAVVREESNLDSVVAVAWPKTDIGAEGVEVFLGNGGRELDINMLLKKVSSRLHDYSVPRQFHVLDELPLNMNGKFDRKKLEKQLQERDRKI